ncbi:hypothetical protein LXL04_032706 [Taraxacum kok-saghyz]
MVGSDRRRSLVASEMMKMVASSEDGGYRRSPEDGRKLNPAHDEDDGGVSRRLGFHGVAARTRQRADETSSFIYWSTQAPPVTTNVAGPPRGMSPLHQDTTILIVGRKTRPTIFSSENMSYKPSIVIDK